MAANRFFRVACDEKLGYVEDDFKAKRRERSPFSRSACREHQYSQPVRFLFQYKSLKV